MPRLVKFACLLSLGVFASCSNFDYRWATTPMAPAANPSAPADGKWEGDWQSDATDYHGHMQAIILHTTQSISSDGKIVQQYQASFRLRTFAEVGFTEFTMTLNATRLDDGRIHFEGKKDMGYFFGGITKLDGFVFPDKDELYCDYNNNKDSGTYKMNIHVQELQ